MPKQPVVKRTPAPATVSDPLNQAPHLKRGKFSSRTKNGYDLMEVVSALQKSIRRCNEKAALFWAMEMQEPLGENNPCGYARYLWKRLTVIASEDIGLVNPLAAILVDSLYHGYERLTDGFKKPPSSAIECLAQAVLYLARCPKNREVDDYLMFMINERALGNLLPMPDYALDNHTFRGKQKGRTDYDFFFTESGKIENVQGPNHYAQFVGDKVNRPKYSDEEGSPFADWEPVHVPDKATSKGHMYAATADKIQKATKKDESEE